MNGGFFRAFARAFLRVWPLLLVVACAQQVGANYGGTGVEPAYAPTRYYAPPGTADDPWGPYIDEASARFDIPGQWIRAVMQQESGGEEQAVSPVGAMGLMQIMPATWEDLRDGNGLGNDPFNPHDNILAGAAYIKAMYDRYGAPGFLAAYNAGPDRLDAYLAGNGDLPDETVNYLAAVTPDLGNAVAMSGPLANYASNGGVVAGAPNIVGFATGCDVNAAYDPNNPCTSQQNDEAVASAAVTAAPAGEVCSSDAAYDPGKTCASAAGSSGVCDADAAYDPDTPCTAPPANVPVVVVAPAGGWGIQVGAFASKSLARAVAISAQTELPQELGAAVVEVPPTTPFGGLVLYRARLDGLSAQAALQACGALNQRQLPCIVLPALGA